MWEKFKFYTKVILFSLLALYLLVVVILNWSIAVNGPLRLVFTEFENPRILMVMLITGVLSIVAWWLIRTIFKTLRQFRTLRERSRTARLEKEVADMKAKAGMLQTREIPPAPTATNSPTAETPNP
jgi:uncharacterized integral membrane protein